jgi:ubiquinone/menaquinone biosynthesis C-methylase UbiE
MKSFEEKSRESYNQKADDYNETFDGKFTERFKELLLDMIELDNGMRVLDVACGNGTLLRMLSSKKDIRGYGIDISDRMILNAKKICPDMEFMVSGCDHTAFPDQMFDVVSVCAAYHHFPDVKAFAAEAGRILKPGGRIYIADVFYSSPIRVILNPFIPLSKAGDVRFYSPREIERNFEAHGFRKTNFMIEGHIQILELTKN